MLCSISSRGSPNTHLHAKFNPTFLFNQNRTFKSTTWILHGNRSSWSRNADVREGDAVLLSALSDVCIKQQEWEHVLQLLKCVHGDFCTLSGLWCSFIGNTNLFLQSEYHCRLRNYFSLFFFIYSPDQNIFFQMQLTDLNWLCDFEYIIVSENIDKNRFELRVTKLNSSHNFKCRYFGTKFNRNGRIDTILPWYAYIVQIVKRTYRYIKVKRVPVSGLSEGVCRTWR